MTAALAEASVDEDGNAAAGNFNAIASIAALVLLLIHIRRHAVNGSQAHFQPGFFFHGSLNLILATPFAHSSKTTKKSCMRA